MDNNDVLNDFRRRWEQTYVWLKMKGKGIETLVYVRQVENDESKVGVLHLESADYGSMTINLGSSDHNLLFRYPPSGVFQHGQQAAYYRRRPARQWRRGICSDNSTLAPTTRIFTGGRVDFGLVSVANAFKHKTYSTTDAVTLLGEKKAKSVALADNFSLALSVTMQPEYMLMFWDNCVGRVNAEGKLTTLYEKVLESEINGVLYGS